MNRKLWITTILTELIGIMVVGAGVGIELVMHAEWGYILITGGALVLSAGGAVYAKCLRR